MAFVSLRIFLSSYLNRKIAGTRSLQPSPGSTGWAHNPGGPGLLSSGCGHSVPRDTQTCWAAIKYPTGGHLASVTRPQEPGTREMLKGKVELGLGWGLGKVSSTQPCSVGIPILQPLGSAGAQCPQGLCVPPAHPAAFPAAGKPLLHCTTARPSSPLCRPGRWILWSSPEPPQMLASSTYHGCECISSRELFWAWHRVMDAAPAGTLGASCKSQASPMGTCLEEPRALLQESQCN